MNGKAELKIWYHSGGFERLEAPDTVAGQGILRAVYMDAAGNDRVRSAELHIPGSKRVSAFSRRPLDAGDRVS